LCPICYGTKFVGGYYDPVSVSFSAMSMPAEVKHYDISDNNTEDIPLQIWTSNLPQIQTDDVLVDINNERFVITNVQFSRKNFYILRQIIQMQPLKKTNPIYLYPIEG
jgi:hypothetical protein